MYQLRKSVLVFVILSAVILSACAPAGRSEAEATEAMPMATEMMMEDNASDEMMSAEGEEQMMEEGEAATMMDESSAEAMPSGESHSEIMATEAPGEMASGEQAEMEGAAEDMGAGAEEMMAAPGWFTAELTNAHNGETFQIADFEGQVVLVETLAMWCTNCLRQQKQVQALHAQLGETPDLVSIGLDIDPNEVINDLKTYTEQHGFDWIYAVAPREVAREIGQLYGDQFLNPPSTPMLIIDRHGEVHPLPFGIKSAADLQAALEPFLNGSM